MIYFTKKNYKIVRSNLIPRLRLGRQAPKNEINIPKAWHPIQNEFNMVDFSNTYVMKFTECDEQLKCNAHTDMSLKRLKW
jgi:hypothetical protein